jgi:hypothetical protein
VAVPDAEIILSALRLALPHVDVSEKGVRAAVQHARSLARWPIDEPAAIFFAFACRPRIAPALGHQLAVFLVRDQLATLGLRLAATDADLVALRMKVLLRERSPSDVIAWFAEQLPAE